jgi:hypothetical protein
MPGQAAMARAPVGGEQLSVVVRQFQQKSSKLARIKEPLAFVPHIGQLDERRRRKLPFLNRQPNIRGSAAILFACLWVSCGLLTSSVAINPPGRKQNTQAKCLGRQNALMCSLFREHDRGA